MINWKDGEITSLTAGGKNLEAICHGPPPDEAPTIILLHEGLGCVALWRDFPQKLSKATGCGVFTYSRAGYGRSNPADLPRPLDYMTQEAMDVLPQVLSQINLHRGILLGHSDGASIAAIYAGSAQDMRVRGLCLIAPHFFTEPSGLVAIKEARQAYESNGLRDRLSKYHEDVDSAFNGWNNAWLDPEFNEWNIGDVIDYFRIPVLAIQGRDDKYGTLAQIDELSERIYAPLEVEILEQCGHSPHVEQPDDTLHIVSDFIRRLCRIEQEIVPTMAKQA